MAGFEDATVRAMTTCENKVRCDLEAVLYHPQGERALCILAVVSLYDGRENRIRVFDVRNGMNVVNNSR